MPAWMAPLDLDQMRDFLNTPVRAEDLYGDAIALWIRNPRLDTMDRALGDIAEPLKKLREMARAAGVDARV